MTELCFNTMNRSSYLLGEKDPDLLGQVRAAGAAGFSAIGPDRYTIDDFCARGGSVSALAEAIAQAGLRTFELPTLMLNTDRRTTRREIDHLASLARVLRPDFVQLNLDSEVTGDVIDDLKRAGDVFGEIGTRLAIEYLPWLPAVTSIRSTLDVLDRAKVDGAGVLVDTWHFTMSPDTWEDLEALPASQFAYVQFDDHPKIAAGTAGEALIEETLMRRAMPGEGDFELERFCEVMKRREFDAVVSCEILSRETREMSVDAFAQRVYETTRTFWD